MRVRQPRIGTTSRTVIEWAIGNFLAEIPRFPLRAQQLDCEIAEGAAGIGTHEVSKSSARVAHLSVGQNRVRFRFTPDNINEVSRAERDGNVRQVVRMKQCGFVSGQAKAKNTHIGILKYQVVVRLFCHRHGLRRIRRLRTKGGSEKHDGHKPDSLERGKAWTKHSVRFYPRARIAYRSGVEKGVENKENDLPNVIQMP